MSIPLPQQAQQPPALVPSGWKDARPRTIKIIKAWKRNQDDAIDVWDFFKTKVWVAWDSESDPKESRKIVWTWIQKVLEVGYSSSFLIDKTDVS